jgi:hypothetical protein
MTSTQTKLVPFNSDSGATSNEPTMGLGETSTGKSSSKDPEPFFLTDEVECEELFDKRLWED